MTSPNPWLWPLLIGAGGTLTGLAVITYAVFEAIS